MSSIPHIRSQLKPAACCAADNMNLMMSERILFITGKLAEPLLRRVVEPLAKDAGFEAKFAVLPITVVALATVDWIRRHLPPPDGIDRVIVPGLCTGKAEELSAAWGLPVEKGPRDLLDLPGYFRRPGPAPALENHSIEIIAEINHAPRLTISQIVEQAKAWAGQGADVIDVGCMPGERWTETATAVRALRAEGLRVSIDSFDPWEVSEATQAGAELVLSVNSSNKQHAPDWGVEVVAIPDQPSDEKSLEDTISWLSEQGVRFRADPILEPIGHAFGASLGRYARFRQKHPDVPMMMGVGNITELTEADSAGINFLLAALCEEWRVGSVLTTEVIGWCRGCVRELDIARKMVHLAVNESRLPRQLGAELVLLRDPRPSTRGTEFLDRLASDIKDSNFRIFADEGQIHIMNSRTRLEGTDPFELFDRLSREDPVDPSHAFYLGYEMCKAITAITLGKNYTQDQSLRWGFLTRPENTHRASRDESS